jgi:hypothetical protein
MLASSLETPSQPPSASARSISRRKKVEHPEHPVLARAGDAPEMRAADEDRARAKRQRLDDVDPAAKAAIGLAGGRGPPANDGRLWLCISSITPFKQQQGGKSGRALQALLPTESFKFGRSAVARPINGRNEQRR